MIEPHVGCATPYGVTPAAVVVSPSAPWIEPHIGCATPCGVRLSARQRRRFILLIFADGTRGLARLAGALVWRPRLKMMLYVTGS